MGKYRQIVGKCIECGENTIYDLHNEIVCEGCGIVLSSPGNNNTVCIQLENNIPQIFREGSGNIPKNTHIVSIADRVGCKTIYIAWNRL